MGIADRYDVQDSMGEGGFSRVYRGQEKATGRPVALKVLKSAFYENAEVRERFQREVFAVASLSNAHIVGMYDFDLNGEDPFIAMEYVAGHTLRERMRDDFTLAQRFSIIAQIADAIGAAHERNVVHRDLKPENVKVIEQPDGSIQVKVLDFGMAKLSALESRLELEPLTRVGVCFGTPQYMSPEQIRGKLDDKSIDLYALATITYELLVGRRPWDGSDPYEVMRAVLRVPAPRIERVVAGPNETLLGGERIATINAFFVRALAKHKAERPEDARGFVAELERAMFGETGAPPARPVAIAAPHRSDDTVPFSAQKSGATLSGVGVDLQVSDTDRNGLSADAVAGALAEHADRLGYLEVSLTSATPPPSARPPRLLIDAELRDQAASAARSLHATRRAERSFRDLLVPLLVIAALGGSLGYLLAGSASAQSSEIHDFLVGKK